MATKTKNFDREHFVREIVLEGLIIEALSSYDYEPESWEGIGRMCSPEQGNLDGGERDEGSNDKWL